MNQKPRVLVIGLDGADPDLVMPWIQAGELPTLAALCRNGTWGRLPSTLPPMSAGAWSSFMTGRNPGKHGVFDFLRRSPGTYHLEITPRSSETTLWGLLSQAGKRVAVINVPHTYPPEAVNGVMISGLGTPSHRDGVYPESLKTFVRQSGFREGTEVRYHPGQEDLFIRQVYESTDRQFTVARELLMREEWDFFMHVFRGTDELAHFYWRHMDATHPEHDPSLAPQYGDELLKLYQHVDGLAGELLKLAGEDIWVFVLSDHGMGPLYKNVFLNEWLRQMGYLTLRGQQAAGMTRHMLRSFGITRDNAARLLKQLGMGRIHLAMRALLAPWLHLIPKDEQPRLADLVDWSRTIAYSHGYIGQIYINRSGREPLGLVPTAAEYEALCERLSDDLQHLVDPDDGQPVVDQVLRRDEVFHGPYIEQAPDLIVLMRGLTYITHEGFEFSQDGRVFVTPVTHESGGHRMDGILAAAGPGIKAGYNTSQAHLLDLAPTLLGLMGCAVPTTMDGKVLLDLFEDGAPNVTAIPQGAENHAQFAEVEPWNERDEQEVLERLRNLGYL